LAKAEWEEEAIRTLASYNNIYMNNPTGIYSDQEE